MTRVAASPWRWPQKQPPAGRHCSASTSCCGRQSEHQVALVGLVGPAHRRGVGARHASHLACEALRQRIQRGGGGDEGRGFVQGGQARALGLQAQRLFLHPRLQALVQALQRLRHAVEAGREHAEFVVAFDFHARRQVAFAHPRQARLQARQRVEDEQVGGVQQRHRAGQRQRHHPELEGVEQRGPARELALDGADEGVDAPDEDLGLQRGLGHRRRRGRGPARTQVLPSGLHALERTLRLGVVRHEQRSRRVAAAQQQQAPVEAVQVRLQLLAVAGGQGLRQAPGLHAHAAGLVHRRRAAFELPGHPQREADRGQRHEQQHAADGAELGRQREALSHRSDCGRGGGCRRRRLGLPMPRPV